MASGLSQVKHIVALGAGKGGVGKSSVTALVAMALQKKGYSVGVLDLDLYGPSIGEMFKAGIIPTPYEDGILPAEGAGLKLMSIAFFHQGLDVNFVRAPIANGIVMQFLHRVFWGELDYLLMDCPPGTSDIHMTVMQEVALSGALLVTTTQEVAILDVRKACQMFIKMQVPVLGVVENMCYYEAGGQLFYPFGPSSFDRLAEEFAVRRLCQIPILDRISWLMDRGIDGQEDHDLLVERLMPVADELVLLLAGKKRVHDFAGQWNQP